MATDAGWTASGIDAAGTTSPGFVRGLLLGEFRASLVFPHAASGDFPRRERSVVGDCLDMIELAASHAFEPPGALDERLGSQAWSHPAAATAPGRDEVLLASRRSGLARAYLDVARGEAPAERGVPAGRAVALARLAAVAYALEASALQAAGWLDRAVEDPGREAAFLGRLIDGPFERAFDDARRQGLPLAPSATGRPRSAGSAGWGAAVAAGPPVAGTWKGLLAFLGRRLVQSASPPLAPTATPMLRPFGDALCRRTAALGRAVERACFARGGRAEADERTAGRLDDAAAELASSACVLARLDASASAGDADPDEHAIAELYLHESGRRCDDAIRAVDLARDPDREALDVGRRLLRRRPGRQGVHESPWSIVVPSGKETRRS